MIKVIIFDFDGVLIDSINNMKFAWKNSCKKCGIKVHLGCYGELFSYQLFYSPRIARTHSPSARSSAY